MTSFDQRPIRVRHLARGTGFTALGLALATSVTACGNAGRGDEIVTTRPASASPSVAKPLAVPVSTSTHGGFVRLPRGTHPLARPEFDEGRVDPEKRIAHLSMFFGLSPDQRTDRDALAAAQLDPKSPSYHHWLTPETYRARFGAKAEDLARASAWLTQQGFDVLRTSRLGTRISFGAKVKDLEAAFQTELHSYRVKGEAHYAMATAPALPADLAGVVLGVHNTHDFFAKPVSRRAIARGMAARQAAGPDIKFSFDAGPDGGPSSFDLLGPPDWATAYDVTKLYDPGIGGKKLDGTGVTVGIVGTAAIAQADIDAFRTTFGLPATTVKMTLVPDTGASAGGRFGAGSEAILDVEWSGGIAKGATINYVYVGADDQDVDDATFYIIEENLAPVMSESYGGCEAGSPASDADILEENGTAANLMGITYMAAAGDDGAADCVEEGLSGLYVDMPGSLPGVTSVGGTQFPSPTWTDAGSLVASGVEAVWNEGNDPTSQFGVGAGGGGVSSIFLRPAWQAGTTTCSPIGTLPSGSTAPMRQVPDVSMSAASGTPGIYVECTFNQQGDDCGDTGGMPFGFPIGGTSASSPSFAGYVAILNQAVGERLGNINPVLYQLEAKTTDIPLKDVATGNNEVICGPGQDAAAPDGGWPDAGCGPSGLYGYEAVTGYDCASGLGSIDGYNLAKAWLSGVKTDIALAADPTMTAEGDLVKLSATVHVDGASAEALTGNVTFAFESFTDSGKVDLSWELGAVAVVDGTTAGGDAVLSTTVPPGIARPGHQIVDVYAFYGGDANHLPSTSAKVQLTFAPLDFAIDPATVTLAPSAAKTFHTTGGKDPVKWYVTVDTTYEFTMGMGFVGASIDENTGAFVAGPKAGYCEVEALDSDGAEAIAEITVGDPTTSPPWADAGSDAGTRDAGQDAGPVVVPDAGHDSSAPVDAAKEAAAKDSGPKEKDAGHAPVDATDEDAGPVTAGGSGCSCDASGHAAGEPLPLAALVGVFGFGFASRRRRRSTTAER